MKRLGSNGPEISLRTGIKNIFFSDAWWVAGKTLVVVRKVRAMTRIGPALNQPMNNRKKAKEVQHHKRNRKNQNLIKRYIWKIAPKNPRADWFPCHAHLNDHWGPSGERIPVRCVDSCFFQNLKWFLFCAQCIRRLILLFFSLKRN